MSSLADFGLSATGLRLPRQADFTADLQRQWQANFGQQVNLDPRSNNGQIISIMAERFALLAELLEAIYNASYPAGAEGVAVDNLLALQGLTRLAASPTRTAQAPVVQADGTTQYGLVCTGDAGTVIPAGSLISDSAAPPHLFALDAAINIQAAQNAVQTLVLNPQPTSGSFALTLKAPGGATYTTPTLAYNAQPRATTVVFNGTAPDGLDDFVLTLAGYGDIRFTASKPGGYIGGSDVAAAINSKFQLSTVSGSGDATPNGPGIVLDFGALAVPIITSTGPYPVQVVPGIQGAINGLTDAVSGKQPFTDVAVAKQGNVFTLSFGAFAPAKNQPATAALPISLVQVASNALANGNTQVNLTVANTAAGHPAQGTGSATATEDGPVAVAAGQLTTIVNPTAGWAAVRNDLDCVPGTTAETDAEALARRSSLVASQAQGPLASILQRVRQVSGVSAAIALTNDSLASQQVVTVGAGAIGGSFTLAVGGQTTQALPYNVSAAALQASLRGLTGYTSAVVTGSPASGLAVLWGNSVGGQGVPLMTVGNNTTGVPISVRFGRYPKAVELVVEGGSNVDVAEAIFAAAPAGLATYGAPVLSTSATTTAGSAAITVLDTTGLVAGLGVECLGLPPGCLITSIVGNTVNLSAAALSGYSNIPASFGFYQPISDSAGNLQIVRFSRPTLVPLFASVSLVTDRYNVPGDPTSGQNPASQFSISSIPAIQAAIVQAVADVGIAGTISLTGTDGVANSFRQTPGIRDATVLLDSVNPPVNSARISLQASQVPDLQLQNVIVAFT